VFADNTIAIIPVAMRDNKCSPEQLAQDESLLAELTEMKSWRREGEVVVLSGSKTLRFRMSTN
jgi:heat shock protein HslJ